MPPAVCNDPIATAGGSFCRHACRQASTSAARVGCDSQTRWAEWGDVKRIGDKWLVQGFRVDSAAMTKGIPSETCPKCGGTYAAGARFCPHCGAALSNKDEAE
jgi:zinc ribbon protein